MKEFLSGVTNLFELGEGIVSRSICGENPTGGKGMAAMADVPEAERAFHPARELGRGWKVRPNIPLPRGEETTLADIAGEGVIRHIWAVHTGRTSARNLILRMYWEGSERPSVEVPFGDFFFNGWDRYFHVDSAAVCVNPARGYNCFWSMPFRTRAKITIENRGTEDQHIYYQIDYQLRQLPEAIGYFHAQFRRTNPLPYRKDYVVLDNVHGKGHYVGTYVAYGTKSNGWWGEGEMKFFLDGDREFPTICGTGTEDYFLAAYNFEDWDKKEYGGYTTLYAGFHPIGGDNLYQSQMRFDMYRLHIADPIYFETDIRVTLQSIGWRSEGRFHPQQDDIASVAFWYLDRPSQALSVLPGRDEAEII